MIFKVIIRISKYGISAVLTLLIVMRVFAVEVEKDKSTIAESDIYITSLIKLSHDLKLYDDIYWHVILHYKKNYFGGYTSQIDDPSFFLSSDGKNSPICEMDATIQAFFKSPEKDKIHPTEKFSARYAWLKQKLMIDPALLPYNGDKNFYSTFYGKTKPMKVIIVFPAGYMNSPASMYGHTFIVIESDSGSRLLAGSINYAANTGETFGPFFAVKGLFGIYHGSYSFLPYFQKIKEYGDSEMRNMWEYELNLTPDEIEKLMRHSVEMEKTYSDYYFIDENCSYNLLYLIEAGRPDTKLTGSFGIGVEPIDTLRAMINNGLVVKKVFRPSIYAKIQYYKTLLTREQQNLVLDICLGRKNISEIDFFDFSDEKKIIICDLSVEYLKFLAVKNEILEKDYRERFLSVLKKRNTFEKYDSLKDITIPVPPDNSHESRRIGIENGYSINGFYSGISYRQSCHELMDPDEGYNMNSQIIFGNISGRYYYNPDNDNKFVLQKFDIIDIISLPPSDSFFFSPCYEFTTGFIQNIFENEKEVFSFWIKGNTGLSTLLADKVQVYLSGGIRSYFAPEYENNTDLQFGAESGILTVLGPWKNHIYGSIYNSPFGITHTIMKAGLTERLKITNSISILCDYSFNKNFDYNYTEGSIQINYYF